MKRNRVSKTERKGTALKQNQSSTHKKSTPINPRIMRTNNSVNRVSTRSNKEHKAKEKTMEEQSIPAKEADLETPNQSIDGVERRTTESTPMPNTEKQGENTKKFSPIGNGDEATSPPKTIKDELQSIERRSPRRLLQWSE